MTGARQAECAKREPDPGKRDGSSRSIAVFPPTGMRFSPIVSIRAGVLRDGYGKFMQFAARLDGREIENRDQAGAVADSFVGEHPLCDELF